MVANITNAEGTMTLKGNWNEEDIAIFQPVLDSWTFYGQYGIQHCGKLLPENPKADFYGCGRWGFSSILESFHEWTLDWIKNENSLTQEQYDAFLKNMYEKDLEIEMHFTDEDEFYVEETGVFTSDGEELIYTVINCDNVEYTWEQLGRQCFDAATAFFARFAIEPDLTKLRKWVKEYIRPDDYYLFVKPETDLTGFLESAFLIRKSIGDFITAFFYDELVFDAFQHRFSVRKDDQWEEMMDFCDEAYGVDFRGELPDSVDQSELEEKESDEAFNKWYDKLK